MVIFQTQRGSNLELLDKQIRKAENTLAQIPEVKTIISVAAFGRDAPGKVTEGVIIARLTDWTDRAKKVDAIMGPLYPIFLNNPDAFVLPVAPKSGPDNGFGRQPIQMVVKTNDMNFLVKASGRIVQEAFGLPSILFAKSSLSLDKPELSVNIDREKALSVGVSTEEIAK